MRVLGASQEAHSILAQEGQRRMRARNLCLGSPHRPSLISTQLTGWGPSSRRGRKEEQDPRPLGSAQGGGGALASRPLPSPYKLWPAPAPAQPVPEQAGRVHCVLSATRLLC